MANKETTTAPETTTPAAPAAPSKMDLCKPLFAGLKDGSIAKIEGKTERGTFIKMAQEEPIGLTASGAATYWQNLVSLDKGGKLYPHTGSKKKAEGEEGKAEGPAEDAVPADAPTQDGEQPKAEDAPAEEGKDENDLSHLES